MTAKKSGRITVNTLLKMGGSKSVVVFDPKGEIDALRKPAREEARVTIINPHVVVARK